MNVESMTEEQARQALRAIESQFTTYNGAVDLLMMERISGTVFQSWRQLREKVRVIEKARPKYSVSGS